MKTKLWPERCTINSLFVCNCVLNAPEQSISHKTVRKCIINLIEIFINQNTLTGPSNCKKTTSHHAHLSLCAKSRKINDAKSRKWPKTSIWADFFGHNFEVKYLKFFWKLQVFLKNRFHSNWRSHLAPTSGQKLKKSLEPFLRKISVSDFGLNWIPIHEYL